MCWTGGVLALRVRLINTGNAGLGMTEELHSLTNPNPKPNPAISLGALLGGFHYFGAWTDLGVSVRKSLWQDVSASTACLPKGWSFPSLGLHSCSLLTFSCLFFCASACFQSLTMPCVALQEKPTFGALLVQVSEPSLSAAAVCPSRAS